MNDNSHYKKVKIDIVIPAFNNKKQGIRVDLELLATPGSQFRVKATGSIAKSLERSFIRVVEIMSSLKKSWNCLETYQYALVSFNEHYNVKDARSADLSLCIAALNIIRNHKQMNSVYNYIGTGTLRIDGSFDASAFESLKEQVINQEFSNNKLFINSETCNHVFDLEVLLNGCN